MTDKFISEYAEAILDNSAGLFVGAGLSRAAGYPDWKELLRDIGTELGVDVDDVADLAALAQWSIQERGDRSPVLRVVDRDIGVQHPIPASVSQLARLPIRHIWTTNYDELIERALTKIGRPYRVRASESDLALGTVPGAALIYKMHGTIDDLSNIVISTDDYELYRRTRSAFLPLLQSHLTSLTMLFTGLSFSDPNLRYVLALIREAFKDSPPQHYGLARRPQRRDFVDEEIFRSKLTQYKYWSKDLRRYGITIVDFDGYDEIENYLDALRKKVAQARVWVSGSWPIEMQDQQPQVYQLSEKVGALLAQRDLFLVTGFGLVVGSASIAGFLDGLAKRGVWEPGSRLIARPFPQSPKRRKVYGERIRAELSQVAGTVIFIGGLKQRDQSVEVADGVFAEYQQALEAGCFLIPIGAFGGSAQELASRIRGSDIPVDGPGAQRPTDEQLDKLSVPDIADIIATLDHILDRQMKI